MKNAFDQFDNSSENAVNQFGKKPGNAFDQFDTANDTHGITGTWAKSTWEHIKEDAPEMTGATVGGIMGGTVGGVPGAIGGATLGGAAGNAYKQIYQHLTGSPDAPQTSFQSAKELGLAGIEQGAYEAVGGLVTKGLSKILAPFAKTLSERGIRAMEVLDKYMPSKYPSLLPAQVTEHRGLDWLHSVAEHSIGGGNVIFKHTTELTKAMEKMTDDMANAFGSKMDSTTLGQTIVDVSQGGWKKFKNTITTPMYNQVEKLVASKGDIVSTLSLKNAIANKIDVISKMKGIAGEESGDALVKAIQDLPDMVDYTTAQELKKRLYSLGQKFKVAPGGASGVGLAKHLTQKIDGAIDSALGKNAPSAQYLWRGVNKIYKEGTEKYNNILIRSLIKKAERNPEKVMGAIFQKGGIKSINRIKTAVGKDVWENAQGWYVRNAIEQSTKQGEAIFNGASFLKRLYNPATGMGKEGVEAILGKDGSKRIKDLANAIRVAQENVAKSKAGGGMMIQIAQAGAIVGLMAGHFTKSAGVLLATPYALARIMTNKTAAKWLTEGIKLSPKSAHFVAVMGRLSNFLNIKDKPEEMPF